MCNALKTWIVAVVLVSTGRVAAAERLTPTVSVGAEERYDDDLLLRTPGGNGQLITKVSPQLGLGLKDPTLTSSVWYAADLYIHHGTGDVGLDHRGHLGLKKVFTQRLRVDADLGIWRVSDPTSLPRLGVARTLSPVLYGRAELAGQYELSSRWTGRVGYRFEGARIYEEHLYGGVMHAPYAEALYNLTQRDSLGVRYRYQYFAFGPESADANTGLGEYVHRFSPVTTFTARAGPAWYQPRGPDGTAGLMPVVDLELQREGHGLEVGAVLGHDLVGASGFTSALWADYASVMFSIRFASGFGLFGVVSYYRNGIAPNFQLDPLGPDRAATGYALGVGAEWRFNRVAAVQATFDRFSQIAGPQEVPEAALSRNIAAVRFVLTAL